MGGEEAEGSSWQGARRGGQRVWQGRAFLPTLSRSPARSFGCFPCLHSKRRLAKKICTSSAAGGRSGPSLSWHSAAAHGCARRAEVLSKSSYGMQAWKAAAGERERGPSEAGSPHLGLVATPRPNQATPTPLPPSSCIFHLLSLSGIPNPTNQPSSSFTLLLNEK